MTEHVKRDPLRWSLLRQARAQRNGHFGQCYICRDFGDHENCVGVPCECECPPPDERKRQELRASALAKLTPQEQGALGV